jgi:hypothetical protein
MADSKIMEAIKAAVERASKKPDQGVIQPTILFPNKAEKQYFFSRLK